jgi:hypothetical protein
MKVSETVRARAEAGESSQGPGEHFGQESARNRWHHSQRCHGHGGDLKFVHFLVRVRLNHPRDHLDRHPGRTHRRELARIVRRRRLRWGGVQRRPGLSGLEEAS